MKELMKSNIYDVADTIVIVGSCLKSMDTAAYARLEEMSSNVYDVCLEETHINMVITKIGGMLRTKQIRKIIFATVDRSPHCTQLHYVQEELRKMMNIDNILIENFVAVDGELVSIAHGTIALSKNLAKLESLNKG